MCLRGDVWGLGPSTRLLFPFICSLLLLPLCAHATDQKRVRLEAWNFVESAAAWALEVREDGHAVLRMFPGEEHFRISDSDLETLAKTVRESHVLGLADAYGTAEGNGPFREIEIWVDARYKRIVLYPRLAEDERRDEVSRALRVWIAIRGLFESDEAGDSRPEDLRIIKGRP